MLIDQLHIRKEPCIHVSMSLDIDDGHFSFLIVLIIFEFVMMNIDDLFIFDDMCQLMMHFTFLIILNILKRMMIRIYISLNYLKLRCYE